MSRVERRSWSACSIASIGVTPTPALTSTTGRSLSSRMNESARGSDLQLVADADVGADVLAGGAVRFDLDADPVVGIAR